ncbi:hypothetical protein JCM11491_004440 [Sporobolomyces phaffii]
MPHWTPPVPVSCASQPHSFAYESTKTRWPKILTGVVDELSKLNSALSRDSTAEGQAKLAEGKRVIERLSGLIYEIKTDKPLRPLADTGFPHDHAAYNAELAQLGDRQCATWFTAPWLFAECYLYRTLRGVFSETTHWTAFDPFAAQKLATWRSSAASVVELATTLNKLVARGQVDNDQELHRDWRVMMETMLWGNATDLSLLTSLTHEQIQQLQSVERGKEFLLRDDLDAAWDHVRTLRDERFDIVLDNSGFELFTDLVLADFLVTLTPFCSHVVIHPKLIPWFVSDVQPHDFEILLSTLADRAFFPDLATRDFDQLAALVERWRSYVASGKFKLSVPPSLKMGDDANGDDQVRLAEFWTSPSPFSDLPVVAPELLQELQRSKLVIFKGDLNYRKLVSDAWWDPASSFHDALGPLRGEISLLSLRTLKADTVVGLPQGKAEQLDATDPDWRVSGKYAVVSFSPRRATD